MAKNPIKVIQYAISPFQTYVMKGAFKNMGSRVWLRTKNALIDIGPAAAAYGYLYYWFQKERAAFKLSERP